MPKQHRVKLKQKDRKTLQQLVSKGKERARVITRCRILLLTDEGKKAGEITNALGISLNTVRQVRQRYAQKDWKQASGIVRDQERH